MRQRFKVLLFAMALAAGVTSSAQASTFLQFQQLVFNNPFTITAGAGVTTITANASVNVIFDPSFCLVAGCGGATNGTYQFSLTANSTGPATDNGTDIEQNFAGTMSFTQGAYNLLTVNFTDILTGGANGSTPTLAASQPPDTFSGSSNVLDPLKLGIPRGFSISFSDWTNLSGGGLTRTPGAGSTITSATADGTGTFNATPAAVVPEPASLMLLGAGLLAGARRVRRRA